MSSWKKILNYKDSRILNVKTDDTFKFLKIAVDRTEKSLNGEFWNVHGTFVIKETTY